MHKALHDNSKVASPKRKWYSYLVVRLLLVIVLFALSVVACVIYLFEAMSGPDTYEEMRKIVQTAVKGNERYVIDEIDRRRLPGTAILRPAWDVLLAYVNELPSASVVITTTGNHMDLVSSEIEITCPNAMIWCKSENGQVVGPRYFFVYECDVLVEK